MRIISKIEINYFRSIYSVTLAENNDINVLIGGNDAGKSNILKALNLFFNNEAELNTPFNFYDDLSRQREEEARAAKGRAFLWIRITFNNFLNWNSLPKTFAIKKSWNRYSDDPDWTYPHDLPLTSIGRFLNKISFHYIPAVRGKDIYQHYMNALHDALIDDEKAGVRGASDALVQAINTSTIDMSEKVKEGIEIDSSIQVPEDLRDLFTALDFSTKFSNFNIPLQKRGDGIQARHIPFILDFIARHSKKYHIWAYEEPENSLEMGKAFDLARQFQTDFSKENQIYLTTHSPAFYDLAGDHVNKWMVEPQSHSTDGVLRTGVIPFHGEHHADETMGIASLISVRAKELYEEIKNLNQSKEKLHEQVATAERPQVFVEGPTDKTILDSAFRKIYGETYPFCDFIPAGGASKITAYLKSLKNLVVYDGVSVIGLYDNDQAGKGKDGIGSFSQHHNVPDSEFKIVKKGRVYCGSLPMSDELRKIEKSLGADVPLPIEFMFPPKVINAAVDEGVLVLEDRTVIAKESAFSFMVNITDHFEQKLPDGYRYLACKVNDSSKVSFSEWVEQADREHWKAFEALFEILKRICDDN
ncbi:MAG: AAA family ATPase [Mariprofundaceae bacterium]|nr:AAA family ATPase [Mariprofundaceae bacterium]